MSEKELYDNNIDSWYGTLQCTLQDTDLGTVCKDNVNTIVNTIFDIHTKQCFDALSTVTGRTKNQGNKLRTYMKFKKDFGCETYASDPTLTWVQKRNIARFRLSDHKLKIETGRHCRPRLPPEQRTCFHCKNCVEDEIHFVIECPLYDNLRNRHIVTTQALSSLENFINILSSKNQNILRNLAMFLDKAFEYRNTVLQ